MPKDIDSIGMRDVANMIKSKIPGLGFALFVFQLKELGTANYISNGQREDMIKALEETLDRLKECQDFPTPNLN